MTELNDTIINVMKFGGKTMRITEKISGDFMVSVSLIEENPFPFHIVDFCTFQEYVVDGSRSSTMKTILARD